MSNNHEKREYNTGVSDGIKKFFNGSTMISKI